MEGERDGTGEWEREMKEHEQTWNHHWILYYGCVMIWLFYRLTSGFYATSDSKIFMPEMQQYRKDLPLSVTGLRAVAPFLSVSAGGWGERIIKSPVVGEGGNITDCKSKSLLSLSSFNCLWNEKCRMGVCALKLWCCGLSSACIHNSQCF